jgi:hypothetical protein
VKANETAALPAWKSRAIEGKKTPNENTLSGGPKNIPSTLANTTHQP